VWPWRRALLASPRLLLLDEPLSGLDLKIEDAASSRICALSATSFASQLLTVTHDRFETLGPWPMRMLVLINAGPRSRPDTGKCSSAIQLAVASCSRSETVQPGRT